MSHRRFYATLGLLLGLGAPCGALVLRAFILQRLFWAGWIGQEWMLYGYFYLYMTIGSAAVFMAFGYWVGLRGDTLSMESRETADTFENLNLLALTDGLTGLYNHRHLQERLAQEIEAANRHKATMAGLMIDLDNFKQINDLYGHPFGDLVLVTVARIIRENLRRIDTAGRYGGEEFMVIMPHTPVEEAMPVAERIRQAVESYAFSLQKDEVHVTLSIGVAVYPSTNPPVNDKSSYIRAMDKALYYAKWRGKNQTVFRASEAASPNPRAC